MKYIIDVPEDRVQGDRLCVMGIMEDSLSHYLPTGIKATPYDESEAEQQGREEAWSFAQKILAPPNNSDALTVEDLIDCYGTDDAWDVVCGMTYQEACEKYEAWKKQNGEIRIGDEVAFHHSDGRPDTVAVVTYIDSDGYIGVMDGRGAQYVHKNPDRWTKTGRTFPEVAELLEKMREPEC